MIKIAPKHLIYAEIARRLVTPAFAEGTAEHTFTLPESIRGGDHSVTQNLGSDATARQKHMDSVDHVASWLVKQACLGKDVTWQEKDKSNTAIVVTSTATTPDVNTNSVATTMHEKVTGIRFDEPPRADSQIGCDNSMVYMSISANPTTGSITSKMSSQDQFSYRYDAGDITNESWPNHSTSRIQWNIGTKPANFVEPQWGTGEHVFRWFNHSAANPTPTTPATPTPTEPTPPTEPPTTPTQPENPFPNANIDPAAIAKITGTSTVEPGADIGDVTRLHNVTVGTTAQIGDRVDAGNSTIHGTVGHDVTLRNATIEPGATVGAGASVKNATVRNGAMVGPLAQVSGPTTSPIIPIEIAGTVPAGAHVTQSVPAGTVHGHTANAEIPTTPGLPSVPGLPGVHYSDMPGNGIRAYLGTGNSLVPGHVAISDPEGNLVAWNTTDQPSHLFAPGLTLKSRDGREETHSIGDWLSAANSPQSCPGLSPSNNNDEAQIAANWERVLKAACGRDSASVGPRGESLTINADPDHLENLLTGSMTSSRLVGDHVARCLYEGMPGEGKSLEWTATQVPPAATLTLKQDGRVLDRAEFTVPQ